MVESLGRSPLDPPNAAREFLEVVRYLTATNGPYTRPPDSRHSSPWHEPVLAKALERLGVIDHYLRGRVALLVADKDRGYGLRWGQ